VDSRGRGKGGERGKGGRGGMRGVSKKGKASSPIEIDIEKKDAKGGGAVVFGMGGERRKKRERERAGSIPFLRHVETNGEPQLVISLKQKKRRKRPQQQTTTLVVAYDREGRKKGKREGQP